MTPNVPLLTKVLEHITAHPEEHDQSEWAIRQSGCGTAYCVAGWAVIMSGHELRWPEYEGFALAVETVAGRLIGDLAEEELGLTFEQARHMFAQRNTLPELWRLAVEYTNGEITPPPEFA